MCTIALLLSYSFKGHCWIMKQQFRANFVTLQHWAETQPNAAVSQNSEWNLTYIDCAAEQRWRMVTKRAYVRANKHKSIWTNTYKYVCAIAWNDNFIGAWYILRKSFAIKQTNRGKIITVSVHHHCAQSITKCKAWFVFFFLCLSSCLLVCLFFFSSYQRVLL